MAIGDNWIVTADQQLAELLSGWSVYTTVIAALLAVLVLYPWLTWADPDTHPFLLARQAYTAPIRNEGQSAAHRSMETPYGYPLKTGLDIKDADSPKWTAGRDGDLRDVWKRAVRGSLDAAGQPTGQRGKIYRVLGRDEVIEISLDDMSQQMNVIGQHLQQRNGSRVAIYLSNSVELLATVFLCAFYKFTPILLPYDQSVDTVLQLLRKTTPDVLIMSAGTLPLETLTHGCPSLQQVVYVVQHGSHHLGWNDEPEGVAGNLEVSVWHELVKKGRDTTVNLPAPGDEHELDDKRLVTVWLKAKDEVEDVVEFTQKNLVAAIGGLVSALPPKQRLNPSDLFLPADSLSSLYPLTLTLAALFSNTSVALNSVAGPGADFTVSTRGVAPTVVVISAETAADAQAKSKAQNPGIVSSWRHWLHSRTLASGRMPNPLQGLFTSVHNDTQSATCTPPGKLRLLYVSQRAQSNSPPLSSAALSDLRIHTGARVVHALTAAPVAGAVAQTNIYDYRREEGDKQAHFGVPLSSLEIKVADTPELKTTDEGGSQGEIVVNGPAVAGGEAFLGATGVFREDHTLAYA